ncbi:hypothetical protein RlegWSM1455_07170 [Rhizobium laguerreae]|uniref:hypothetical protein n=1 Tax=Rhizobium laguerreae TaxID=1076926 RepID=UPI001E5DD0DB|nr:hypothetical protein [Rhizobium laguerreae]UFW65795.1 hypothetical protein RlegWSM1455_07170 [Rhizobium laguerreae]
MLIDVYVDQRKVQAWSNVAHGKWMKQCVGEAVGIDFGEWIADIELSDIYEDVDLPVVEVAAW